MKKLLKIIGGTVAVLLVVVVAAALILPSVILGKYQDKIISMIGEQTGRDVTMGDMSLRILPNPQLQIKDVSVPSVEGAAEDKLASMDSFRVNVAILPLLSKTVKIKTIELVNANVTAEILPDGSNNWTFTPKDKAATDTATTSETAATDTNAKSGFKLVVNDIRLVNGEIIYINRAPGARQLMSLSKVNVTGGMQSMTGPFKAKGDLVWNGNQLNIDLKTGQLEGEKPSQFDVKVGVGNSHSFSFDGEAAIKPAILINGKIMAESANPAALVKELDLKINGLPSAPVKLSSDINANQTSGKAENLAIAIDKSSLDGNVDWSLGDNISVNATLRGRSLDVDQILASLSSSEANTAVTPAAASNGAVVQEKAAFKLPNNINLNLDAQIQRLIYNQQDVSNIKLLAQMQNGQLDISDASAVLPGSSPIGASATVTNGENSPKVNGQFNFTSERLKDLVAWVGGDVSAIPDERFKTLNIRSDIAGTLEQVTLSNLNGQIDETNLQGSVAVAMANRMRVSADLKVDQIQLDPWMAAFSKGQTTKTSMGDAVISKAYAADAVKALVPLDVNLKLAIAKLVYQGVQISGIATDLAVVNDNLTINSASVNDLAGAQIGATGQIENLGGTQTAKDLKVSLKASSIAGLLKLANVDIGVSPEQIGAVSSNITLNGSLKNNINMNAALQALGGSYAATGQVNPKNVVITGLDFAVKHSNLNQVTAVLAPDTKIPAGVQSVDIKGRAEVSGKKYGLSNLSGTIGSSNIKSGNVTADLSGAKPYIAANITAGTLNLDALQSGSGQKSQKQKTAQASQRAEGTPPWSDDVIDFSPLNKANTDIVASADTVIISGKTLTNVQLKQSLKDGLMNVNNLSANAYGGSVKLAATVDGRSGGAISTNVNIAKLGLGQLAKDMAGVKLPVGTFDLSSDLKMSGNTTRKLVSSLNGSGNLKVAGLGKQNTNSEFDAFLGLLQKIGSLAGAGVLDISSDFTATNGVINVDPLTIKGPIGGNAKGNINLPAWTLDISGAFTFLDSGITQLVLAAVNKTKLSELHSFRIYGSLDKPNMDLPSDLETALNLYKGVTQGDITALLNNGVTDQLLEKLGLSGSDASVVQGLVNVLGGTASATKSTGNTAGDAAKNVINNLVGGGKQTTTTNNNNKTTETTTTNNDPIGNIINEQVDKALGTDNKETNDAAKELLNKGANELLKGLFN
ncbi:MAG: AsmA family protein [Alphaproteobacteria bacterium]